MQNSGSNSLISFEQIFEKLFIQDQSGVSSEKSKLRINVKLLKKLSEDGENYRTSVELVLILQRILNTGKKKISLREMIYKRGGFRNSEKALSLSGSNNNSSYSISPKKNHESLSENKYQSPTIKNNYQSLDNGQAQQQFVSDELTNDQKQALLQSLNKIKSNLIHTVYETKINQIINSLYKDTPKTQFLNNDEDNYKKILAQNCLGLDANKNPKIEQFIIKGYQSLDGKFSSFLSLYQFLSNEVLPLIQRKILSISIRSHQERQSFIAKAITFLSEFFLHQYVLQIKINKATLIQNRIFVEKVFKQNFKRNQTLIIKNLTNILNEALLCPSNMAIQLPLFRLLKRMYSLWGVISQESSQFIELKNDSENIGHIIKYPLLISLKNISLYCKPIDNEDEIKQAAMFCYKILNLKEDLYLCNEIQTLSEIRYIKESKYFSSKAYAFSEEISRIYDTFDLRMGFWRYYKRIERGQVWVYNVLVEKPNSLLIWQFYLQGHDIGFGIYKVEGMKKHTIEEYSKQSECKEILKLQKYTVTQSQPQKGFMFLKNGLYRLIFDNSYSSFRGKDLSYMFLHLQSEG